MNAQSAPEVPNLAIDHYQKRYGDTVAVRDLSLEVEPGDIYGFIGHNGAGKTTLIRSIVGVQSIDGAASACAASTLRATPSRPSASSPMFPTIPTSTNS